MRNRDPHRENVGNILAICLPILTMQHIKESCYEDDKEMEMFSITVFSADESNVTITGNFSKFKAFC